MVLAFVVENDVHFLGAVATDVGSYKEDQNENDTKIEKDSLDFMLTCVNAVDVLLVFLVEESDFVHILKPPTVTYRT